MSARHYSGEIKKIKALKKLIPIITTILLMAIFITPVNAQVTGTATGSVTVLTPIAIANVANLNFGSVAVSETGGKVILTPSSLRSISGGLTYPSVAGNVSAASFKVTGFGSAIYSILLPTSLSISDGAGHSMAINAFTSTPSGTGTLSEGTQIINVGATLNVGASQVAGDYTNSIGFPVVVNYN